MANFQWGPFYILRRYWHKRNRIIKIPLLTITEGPSLYINIYVIEFLTHLWFTTAVYDVRLRGSAPTPLLMFWKPLNTIWTSTYLLYQYVWMLHQNEKG